MKTALCILLVALTARSSADLSDYLKAAECKADIYKMRNIDFIYGR